MNCPEKGSASDLLSSQRDFSLILGGPLFQILRRAHLSDNTLQLVHRRIIAAIGVTWLPLLLLSLAEGRAWGPSGAVPFLKDVEVHGRFLVALPLLIAAELIVHNRMRKLIAQFLERNLIPQSCIPAFNRAIESALRLRNSMFAEVALLASVCVFGVLVRQSLALETTTWSATVAPERSSLTIAGFWFAYVSMPIFQFLLLRWYLRLFVWARFLWQVSRIELDLIPTHPDRAGGLGFLTTTVYSFVPLLVAHGALLSGLIANRIFFTGASLPDFKFEIATLTAFLLVIILGPLLVFTPQLAAVRRRGLSDYGTLAERYVREFEVKWLRGGADRTEALLGSADIQSLADMGNSYDVVRTMRHTPFSKEAILQLGAATLAPIVPLLLTMMSLEDVLKSLFGILF